MAPSHSRQLLVWTLPTIAVLLSYLWYKKKRIGNQSVPSSGCRSSSSSSSSSSSVVDCKENKQQLLIEQKDNQLHIASTPKLVNNKNHQDKSSPNRTFCRSLSGVDSAPIDIIIPPKLKQTKSNPVVISDEDLDLEIEKIKSMKYGGSMNKLKLNDSVSPIKSKNQSFIEERCCSTSSFSSSSSSSSPLKTSIIMAQKDIVVVEEKLSVLNLASSSETTSRKSDCGNNDKSKLQRNNKVVLHDLQRQNSERTERDSANHSPADVMLASPSLSSISDNHSEGSNDSGKGGSDMATPPPSRTPGTDDSIITGDVNLPTLYEFVIPQLLVGKLIGKHGSFVAQIKDKTNAHIIVKNHPSNNKLKVCVIEGCQKEIDSALKLIRDKFPLKRFPDVTLEQVSFHQEIAPISLVPDHLYLKLVEGINNDTIVSCMVSPNHLFLQQPTHPSFLNLNVLNDCMNLCYNEADSPLLPTPIPENTICTAYSVGSWCRAMILSTDTESDTSYVKFLDYGGYAYVENSKLRQIRGDFLLLPFQAAECFLANVKSIGEENVWPEAAYNFVAEITKGAIIYTQILDYSEDGVPLVHCYLIVGPQQIVFLNQELVNQGFAEWITYEVSPDNVEGAVGLAV